MPDFIVKSFENKDLHDLEDFQPPDWKPIQPHFEFYLKNGFCKPLKIDHRGVTVAVGTLIFHKDTVWLAHIIVHPEMRNRGLGKRMTNALLEQVDSRVYQSVFLMSTELGYPVYKSLGFETEDTHVFLMKDDSVIVPESEFRISDASPVHHSSILELDKKAYDEDRFKRIYPHLKNAKIILENREVKGFYLPDLNEGPVIASDEKAGLALMNYRLASQDVAILPESNEKACKYLSDLGFQFIRKARRMYLGKRRQFNSKLVFNRVSGQIG